MRALIRRSVDHHIILAFCLAIVIFFASLFGLAGFVDDIARQREESQVKNALQSLVEALAAPFPGQLDWDDAVQNLDNRFDESWASTNVGHYFCGTLHFDSVYVLDSRDRPIYGMRGAESLALDDFGPFSLASAPLLESIRKQEARRGPFIPPFRASGGDIAQPIQASGMTRVGPVLFVLTATLVQPNNGLVLPAGPKAPIVISAKRIDAEFLRPINEGLLVENLHLLGPEGHAGAQVALEDVHGERIANLGWLPSRPGAYLVSIAFLPILIAVCLPLGLYVRGRRISRRLAMAIRELEDVAASVPGVIFSYRRDASGQESFPFASPAIEDVMGLKALDVATNGAAFAVRVNRDDLVWLRREISRSARDLSPWHGEYRYHHPVRGERWIEANSRPRAKPDGSIVWHGFVADVTERKVAEATLRNAAAVLANTGEGVVVTDLDGMVTSVNPAFTTITGFAEAEVLGKNLRVFQAQRFDRAVYDAMWKSIQQTGSWQGEVWSQRKGGETYPKWVTVNTVQDKNSQPVGYVGTLTDISQLKATERRLEQLATHDPLTGLPNRLILQARLEHALARTRRQAFNGAVLFLDLDRFKTVNDSLGHAAGDQVLCTVSTRLKSWMRDIDTLTRLGGDEFVILLEDLPGPEYVAQVARRLIEQVLEPIVLEDGQEIFISTSIGISLFPGNGETPEELIRNADAALYLAKEDGRGGFRFFTDELTKFASAKLDLESRLRRAMERHEFVLHYQPLVSLHDRRLKGVEALIRWRDPERGIVGPAQFIGLAEDTGLIVSLGNWALRTACAQMKAWRDSGLENVTLSVNISPVQFRQGNLVAQIERVLAETGLEGSALELEITEDALMHATSDAAEKLQSIRNLGIKIAIDDFGTGHSSLAHLKRFPIDTLKIDQGFVRGISHDSTDRQIVIALIALANSLSFESVAEGIETEEQIAFLIKQGCASGQGYLFGQALAAEEMLAYLVDETAVEDAA